MPKIIENLQEKLLAEVARGEKMLSNPRFVEKAPQALVETEKNKLEQNKKALLALEEKLAKNK